MSLEDLFEEILIPPFPLKQLKKLHADLTEFENYLQIHAGGYSEIKSEIDKIYSVQSIIEKLVRDNKKICQK